MIEISPSFAEAGGYHLSFSPNVSAVPEPSSWALLGLGFVTLGYAGWRRLSRGRGDQFGVDRTRWADANPVREIFRDACARAGLPYFTHPRSETDLCNSRTSFGC
jgi:hypothetical protein